jgi:hypothetical protein
LWWPWVVPVLFFEWLLNRVDVWNGFGVGNYNVIGCDSDDSAMLL